MKNFSYKKFTLAFFTLAAVFSFGFFGNVMGSEGIGNDLKEAFGGRDVEAFSARTDEVIAQTGAADAIIESQPAKAEEDLQSKIENSLKQAPDPAGPNATPEFKPFDDSNKGGYEPQENFQRDDPVTNQVTTGSAGAADLSEKGLTLEDAQKQIDELNKKIDEITKGKPNETPGDNRTAAEKVRATQEDLVKKQNEVASQEKTVKEKKTALDEAKAKYKDALTSDNKTAVDNANSDYAKEKENLAKAKSAAEEAGSNARSATSGKKWDAINEAKDVRSAAQNELKAANERVDVANQQLQDHIDNLPDYQDEQYQKNSDSSKNGENDPLYKKDLQEYNEKLEEYKNNAADAGKSQKAAQEKYNNADKMVTNARKDFWKNLATEGAWHAIKFMSEQMIMSVLFSVIPDVAAAIAQHMQNEALYHDIMEVKIFGGIKMMIPAGLVPSGNPSGGTFVYCDVQDDSTELNSDYLRSPARRYFVSYDPDGYANPATYYIDQPDAFPGIMLELGTGLIFDASGSLVAPHYNTSQLPFFFPFVVTIADQTLSPVWTSNAKLSLEDALSALQDRVNGHEIQEGYSTANIANLASDSIAGSVTTGGINADVSYMFASLNDQLPVIIYNTLQQYIQPKSLDGFGIPATSGSGASASSTPGVSFMVQELQGLNSLARIFGAAYFDIFVDPAIGANESLGSLKDAFLSALDNAMPDSTIKDVTNPVISPNLKLTDKNLSSAIDNIRKVIPTAGIGDDVGFPTTDHILAHGLPIYQTDSTPTAQFLKEFVGSTSNTILANYIHDVVMPLDSNGKPVIAFVPTIVPSTDTTGGTIEYQQNPEVEFVVSLISGLTYQKNGGFTPLSETTPNATALGILKNVIGSANSSNNNNASLQQQIIQVRDLYNLAITEGPFVLDASRGLYAYRLTLDAMLNQSYDGVGNTNNDANNVSNAAQNFKAQQTSYGLSDLENIDYDTFVYMIPNALKGVDDEHDNAVINLPDYVIPVSIDPASGNFVIVPLGSQAMVTAGGSVAVPSTQVKNLISLVTSCIYSLDYKLSTAKTYLGGTIATQLGTEFMETDLNPVNFDSNGKPLIPSQASIPVFWFLNLNKFSYCSGLMPQITASGAYDGATFLSSAGCTQPSPFQLSLSQILPESFTGISYQDVTPINSYLSSTPTVNNPSSIPSVASLLSALHGGIPSIYQVHNSWHEYQLSINTGEVALATKSQKFCDNSGHTDISITATNADDVINGNYFYYISDFSGLFVLAYYTPSVSSTPLDQVSGGSISLSGNFSNIGSSFGNLAKANALINIGTGQVLVKVPDASSPYQGTYTLKPLTRYSGPLVTPSIPLGPIVFSLQDIINAVQATQGKVFSKTLNQTIKNCQSSNTNVMGPFSYGSYTLTIDPVSYNNGNYIYTAKTQDNVVRTYFITYDSGASVPFNKPFLPTYVATNPSEDMVDIITGDLYNVSGVVRNGEIVRNMVLGLGITDKAAISTHFLGVVAGVSGNNNIPTSLSSGIAQLSQEYANAIVDPVIYTPSTDSDTALKYIKSTLTLATLDVATLNNQTPLPGTNDQLIFYNNQYYLRSKIEINGLYNYYQFNVAPMKAIEGNPLQFPTGAYYDEKGNVTSVLVSYAALKMLNAYGLQIDSTGASITTSLPVLHPSLPMTTADIGLANGAQGGCLMKIFPGTSPIKIPKNPANGSFYTTYQFYQNIFHDGAPAIQVGDTTGLTNQQITNYAGVNQYSPYDTLLQVSPSQTSPNGLNYLKPYYISLITGNTYDLEGKQLYENVELYFQDTKGSLPINLPLMIWGDDIMSIKAMFGSSVSSDDVAASGVVSYNTYQVDPYGISYEYVVKGSGNSSASPVVPPTIYTFTYQDPTSYYSEINPAYSFLTHLPTAIQNSDGTYSPAPDGSVYQVDNSTKQILKTYNATKALTQDATGIVTAIKANMAAALLDNNFGVIYKIVNGVVQSNPIGNPITKGSPNYIPLKSLLSYINVPNTKTFAVNIVSSKLGDAIAANVKLVQNANKGTGTLQGPNLITGVVYQVDYSQPVEKMIVNKFPADGAPLTLVAPATELNASDIEAFAAKNLSDAFNYTKDPKNNLLISRTLMNMTNIVSSNGTFPKIVLTQNAVGLEYSLYQPGSSNNRAPLATYNVSSSNFYQANVLSCVGQRSITNPVTSTLTSTFDDVVLIKNMSNTSTNTTKNPDYIIFENTFYVLISPLSDTSAQYQPICPDGSTTCPNSTNFPINFSIQDLSTLMSIPATAQWPTTLPNLVTSSDSYVSIKYLSSNYNEEYVYQYTYPLPNPSATAALLNSINVSLVGSTNGILTPIVAIDTTSLKPIGYTDSTSDITQQVTKDYTDAIANINTKINTLSTTSASISATSSSQSAKLVPSSVTTTVSKGQSCPDGYATLGVTRTGGFTCKVMGNPLLMATNSEDPNSSNNAQAALQNSSNAVTGQLNQAVLAAQENADSLSHDEPVAVTAISNRMKKRIKALKQLSYRTFTGADSNGGTSTLVRLYYQIDKDTFNLLSIGTNVVVGDYVMYPIGNEQSGFIYNGTAPTTAQKDANGKVIPPALALGTPTGASLSSSDMLILKSLIGMIILPSSTTPTDNQKIQNGIVPLTIGTVSYENLLNIADLLPGNNLVTKYPDLVPSTINSYSLTPASPTPAPTPA